MELRRELPLDLPLELQDLQDRLAVLECECRLMAAQNQRVQRRFRQAERRLKLMTGLALVTLFAALFVTSLPHALANDADTILARLLRLESRTQFMSADARTKTTTFNACNVRIQNGLRATNGNTSEPNDVRNTNVNGLGNLIIGYNEGAGAVTGSHNLIVGNGHSYSSFGGIVAGRGNEISAPYAAVLGGLGNRVTGNFSVISGGASNTVTGDFAAIVGGEENVASSVYGTINGGDTNTASGMYATVSGGSHNQAAGTFISIAKFLDPTALPAARLINQQLRKAVERGDFGAIAGLLARDADVETRAPDGRTPLMVAASAGNLAVVQLLVYGTADVDAVATDADGFTPLFFALGGDGRVLNYLLDKDAAINFQNPKGETPLMIAAQKGYPTAVKILLSRHARTDCNDKDGRTALSWATEMAKSCPEARKKDYQSVIKLLQPDPSYTDADTGVTFNRAPEPGMLPNGYTADALDGLETERCMAVLRTELRKYPAGMLHRYLKTIYLVKNLCRGGAFWGGTNRPDTKAVFICDNPGYANYDLATSLHHELGHLLVDTEANGFSRSAWQNLNPPGFSYNDDAVEGVRTDRYGGNRLDPNSWPQGFCRDYGTANFDEDTATVAELLFSGDARFWGAMDRYPVLQRKANQLADFYNKLDPTFTLDYFRHLPLIPVP